MAESILPPSRSRSGSTDVPLPPSRLRRVVPETSRSTDAPLPPSRLRRVVSETSGSTDAPLPPSRLRKQVQKRERTPEQSKREWYVAILRERARILQEDADRQEKAVTWAGFGRGAWKFAGSVGRSLLKDAPVFLRTAMNPLGKPRKEPNYYGTPEYLKNVFSPVSPIDTYSKFIEKKFPAQEGEIKATETTLDFVTRRTIELVDQGVSPDEAFGAARGAGMLEFFQGALDIGSLGLSKVAKKLVAAPARKAVEDYLIRGFGKRVIFPAGEEVALAGVGRLGVREAGLAMRVAETLVAERRLRVGLGAVTRATARAPIPAFAKKILTREVEVDIPEVVARNVIRPIARFLEPTPLSPEIIEDSLAHIIPRIPEGSSAKKLVESAPRTILAAAKPLFFDLPRATESQLGELVVFRSADGVIDQGLLHDLGKEVAQILVAGGKTVAVPQEDVAKIPINIVGKFNIEQLRTPITRETARLIIGEAGKKGIPVSTVDAFIRRVLERPGLTDITEAQARGLLRDVSIAEPGRFARIAEGRSSPLVDKFVNRGANENPLLFGLGPLALVRPSLREIMSRFPIFGGAIELFAKAVKQQVDNLGFLTGVRDPRIRNILRLGMDIPKDAWEKAQKDFQEIIDPLIKEARGVKRLWRHKDAAGKDYNLFAAVALHRELAHMGNRGMLLAREIDPEIILDRLRRYEAQAVGNVPVQEALRRHKKFTDAMGKELVERQRLDRRLLVDWYYPIEHMEFSEFDEYIAQGLREPARHYTKLRTGGTGPINISYEEMMLKRFFKVSYDNEKEDLIDKVLKQGDYLQHMKEEEKLALFGNSERPQFNVVYPINGKRYKAYRPRPGNNLVPAQSETEKMLLQSIEEASEYSDSAIDSLARKEPLESVKGFVPLKPQPIRPATLLEEDLADALAKFSSPKSIDNTYKVLAAATSIWKRITLNFAGVPFQMVNFYGDTLNLYREYGMEAVLNMGRSANILWHSNDEKAKFLINMAKEQRSIGGRTVFFGKTLERRSLVRGGFRGPADLLNIIETISEFRENVPRLAAFLTDYDKILRTGEPVYSKTIDLRGLTAIEAAGKRSREALVDYGAVTPEFRKTYRQLLFPFATWYVQNTKNWANHVLHRPVDTTVRFGLPLAAVFAWNNYVTGDIEKNLSDELRFTVRINTLWLDKEGRPIIIRIPDPFTMALQMGGFDRVPFRLSQIIHGELSKEEAAEKFLKEDLGMAPLRSISMLVSPVIRVWGELLANRDSYTGRRITKEKLRGGKYETENQIAHVMSSFFTPYSQYLRVQGGDLRIEGVTDVLTGLMFYGGPLDFMKALGVRTVDIDASRTFLAIDKTEEDKIKRNEWLETVTRSLLGQTDTPFLETILEAVQSGYVTPQDIENRFLAGNDVSLRFVQQLLKQADDPAARRNLRGIINWMRQMNAFEATPKGLRTVEGVTELFGLPEEEE